MWVGGAATNDDAAQGMLPLTAMMMPPPGSTAAAPPALSLSTDVYGVYTARLHHTVYSTYVRIPLYFARKTITPSVQKKILAETDWFCERKHCLSGLMNSEMSGEPAG